MAVLFSMILTKSSTPSEATEGNVKRNFIVMEE